MSKYKYKNPVDQGFKKVRVSRKQFKEILPKKQNNIFLKKEFYINEHCVLVENSYSLLGRVLIFVLIPATALMEGLVEFRLKDELNQVFRQKEKGKYFIDNYFKIDGGFSAEVYNKVLKLSK